MNRSRPRPSLGSLRALVAAALAASGVACDGGMPDEPFARAREIGGLDEGIGGDLAIARPGDFVLENDRVRVAILSGRNSMGPGIAGGTLVDADLQLDDPARDGGTGNDQWNEMFPLMSMNVPNANEPGTVEIVADGSDGGPAVVRVRALAAPFISVLDLLWGLVAMPDMAFVHDYVAEPGKPWITMRTTVTLRPVDDDFPAEGQPMERIVGNLDVIGVGMTRGIVGGDFWLAGANVDVFAPGIGFDEDGAVFRAAQEGRNTFTDPFRFPFVAAVGPGVSYGLAVADGEVVVPLFASSQTAVVGGFVDDPANAGLNRLGGPAPSSFTYERQFLIGHGDVGSIVDGWLELTGAPKGRVEGRVVEQGTGVPMTGIDVFVFEPGAEMPFSQWRTDVHPQDRVKDGSFGGYLPVGDWELLVHRAGRADGPRVPIRVEEGGEVTVRLESLRPGVLTFRVKDERGRTVPAKVTIYKEDEGPARQPALGDGNVGGDPLWVVFADRGTGEVELPEGNYRVIASRGTEYELDISEPFRVDAGRGAHLDLRVVRSIDTTGWISADFHVHSAPSHDSGVTLPDRVRTYVAEGVEFFAATDHDVNTDFAPVVEALGLEPWVKTAVGVETTTIEVGHFLGFPMQKQWLAESGGAYDWTDRTPQEILDNLRAQGQAAGYDPLVFVAHPRSGILGYFDQFGVNPYGGTVAAPGVPPQLDYNPFFGGLVPNPHPVLQPGNLTMDFDALELFTGKELWTIRTPTMPEVEAFAAGEAMMYDWLLRTKAEQDDLIAGVVKLSPEFNGVIEDWFAMLNLGFRHTAIGNSDTHDKTSIEAGCPRNYVLSSTDSPFAIDEQEIADAVKAHRVVASYGPFVEFWIDEGMIGDEIQAKGGKVQARISVQAPTWIDVDVVQLYENGTLIREFDVSDTNGTTVRFDETFELEPARDAWYVVMVSGDGSMAPVFTPVDLPPIPLDEVVYDALGELAVVATLLGDPAPYPKVHPTHPFAITNPIWVDVDGNGWQAPGHPAWWSPGEEK